MIIALRAEPNITDTNIDQTEDGVAVCDEDTDYSAKDIVQINDTINRKYRATQASKGVNPTDDVNETTGVGDYWVDYGATNYAKPFEVLNSDVCVNADTIDYTFAISDTDTLLLTNIKANSVRVIVTNLDTDTVVRDVTTSTKNRDVYDWADWTYAIPEYQKTFYMLLPMVYNASLQIIIDNTGGDAEVGHIVFGRSKKVGLTLAQPNPTTSRRGLTSKSRDAFGNIITRKKARYKRMTINCLIDSKNIDIVENRLDSFVDKPCIFVGDEREGGYKVLSIFGEIKDHDMPIGIVKTQYQIEVEGYL